MPTTSKSSITWWMFPLLITNRIKAFFIFLDEKELVVQTLERWLDIQIDRSILATWQPPLEKVRL
jgi:hypothetical protein